MTPLESPRPPHLAGKPHVEPPPPDFTATFIALGLAFLVDAVFSGTMMFTVLGGMVFVPLGIVRLTRAPLAKRRQAAWALVAALLSPGLAFGALLGNVWHANAHRDEMVRAIDAYHAREGRYPQALSDLVPRDLRSVPRAKYVVFLGGYDYYMPARSFEGDDKPPTPLLYYVVYPPFMRATYRWEDRTWFTLD